MFSASFFLPQLLSCSLTCPSLQTVALHPTTEKLNHVELKWDHLFLAPTTSWVTQLLCTTSSLGALALLSCSSERLKPSSHLLSLLGHREFENEHKEASANSTHIPVARIESPVPALGPGSWEA